MILTVLTLAAIWMPASADTDCAEAYRRGCYERSPFKGCCSGGRCQSAKNKITCSWGVNQPCCPELQGQFIVDPEPECEKACYALGSTGLSAKDFCPGSQLEASLKACPKAHSSWAQAFQTYTFNNKTRAGLCSANAVATCSWSYPGVKDAEKDNIIGGHFSFGTDEVTCFDVCTELGSWGVSSSVAGGGKADYCNMFKEMSEPGKYKCLSGAKCFSDPSSPGCEGVAHASMICGGSVAGELRSTGNTANSSVATQSLRTAAMPIQVLDGVDLDDYCNQAFQDGCWKSDDFSGCCSQCSSGRHDFTCGCTWDFTFRWGSSNSDTQTISQSVKIPEDPQGTVGSCGETCSCQAACKYLGDPTNNPCWYCNIPEQWKDAKANCPGAFNFSVNPDWCSSCKAKEVLLATEDPLGRDPVLAAAGATMTLVAMVAVVATLKYRWETNGNGHQGLLQG